MLEGFSVKMEYHFYVDKSGKQKFTSTQERNLNARITLKNRLAFIINAIELVWSLK